jgi:type 1 fimbria pilin
MMLWKQRIRWCSWLLLVFPLVASGELNKKYNYTVAATITRGSCQVSLPGGSTLDVPQVDRALLQNGSIQNPTPFDVEISNCIGTPTSAPTLTVTGNTIGTSEPGKYLFNNGDNSGEQSSKAQGYGITLSETSLSNWDTNKLLTTDQEIHLTNLEPNGEKKTLYVGVGCGTQVDCRQTTLVTGSLQATLTFSFAYK